MLEIASFITLHFAQTPAFLLLLLVVAAGQEIDSCTSFWSLSTIHTGNLVLQHHLTRLHLSALDRFRSRTHTHTLHVPGLTSPPARQLRQIPTGLHLQEESQENLARVSPAIGSPSQRRHIVAASAGNPDTTTTQAIPVGPVASPPHSALPSPSLDLAESSSSTSRQTGPLRIKFDANPPDDKTCLQCNNTVGGAVSRGNIGHGPSSIFPGSELGLKQPFESQQQEEDHHAKTCNKMIFTNLYKSPKSPLSRLRHPHHPIVVPVTQGPTEYNPDLVSKDKSKQKDAVKRHLKDNVRNDWCFTWPPDAPPAAHPPEPAEGEEVANDAPLARDGLEGDENALDTGDEADSDSGAESVYSTVSDDPVHWKPRLEWESELSDDELPYNSPSQFKFDSPDSVGHVIAASKIARKARRRRDLRKETAWNDGLACFEARRAAWTGAKVARLRPKITSPSSPASPRRAKFWRTHTRSMSNVCQPVSPLTQLENTPLSFIDADTGSTSPNTALSPKTSRTDSQKQPQLLPVETLLPIPPPLLPPANPMRASINPTLYNSIYEKVVVNNLQPSCPINLSDMVRACVSGWKRDGEWPPRSAVPEPAALVAVRRNKSSKSVVLSSSTKQGPAPGRKMNFPFLGSHHGRTHENDGKPHKENAAGVEEGPGPGKAIRRSLQRVLGIGQTMVTVADGHDAVQDH